MQIAAYNYTHPSMRPFLQSFGGMKGATDRGNAHHKAGITLVETLISLMIVVIGLAGLFGTSARSFTLLRRSKEIVAVRECVLTRIDSIRALSFAQVARSASLTAQGTGLLVSGTAGDPNPFTGTIAGMKNFTETVTVYALGEQLFSSDAQRAAATPAYPGQVASQLDSVAPNAPKTYQSNSGNQGDWTQQVANSLPYYQVTRVGTGASAQITINNSANTNPAPGDLSKYPALCVDIVYTWTDSSNVTRSQVGTMILARNGSLQ